MKHRHGEYRHDIDGLRGLAVLIVVLFHLKISSVSGGFVGVDVFFVISGFLITRLIYNDAKNGSFNFLRFYVRRIKRLFPALFVVVIATLIASFYILSPARFSDLAQSSMTSLLSVSNIYFFFTADYFGNVSYFTPLLHTWSLSIEEQFYLIWPAAIIGLLALKSHRLWLPLSLVIAIITSLILAELYIAEKPSAVYYLLPFRLGEFAIGALIVFLPQIKNKLSAELLSICGIAAIFYAAIMFTDKTRFPGLMALVPTLGAAAIIYGGQGGWLSKVLSLSPLTYIGKISYCLYLTHWPIIVLYSMKTVTLDGFTMAQQMSLFAASFISALALHYCVEKPLREKNDRQTVKPKPSPQGVGLAYVSSILAVTLACAFIWGRDGIPSRFNNKQEIVKLHATLTEKNPINYVLYNDIDEAAPTVLLAGDSHAEAMTNSLTQWGIKNDVKVKSVHITGCVPLFDIYVVPDVDDQCAARDKDFKRTDIDLVVLVARWGLYTNEVQNGLKDERALKRSLHKQKGEAQHYDTDLSRDIFIEGLNNTTAYFNSHDIPVIFVSQVPPVGRHPGPCISTKTTLAEVEALCNFADRDFVNAEIEWATQAAQAVPNLIVFDTKDMFCSKRLKKKCKLTHKGSMLYKDDDHLSASGARFLIRKLRNLLKEQLPSSDI